MRGMRRSVLSGPGRLWAAPTAVQDAPGDFPKYVKRYVSFTGADFFRAEIMSVEAQGKGERQVQNQQLGHRAISENGSALSRSDARRKVRLDVDGLFIAVGLEPDNGIFSGLIPLDEGGSVQAGESCETPVPGIFAAGDCRTKTVRQLTTAMADGTVAGLAACRYIETAAGEKNRLS